MDVQTFENTRWGGKRQSAEFRHEAALELLREGPVLDVGCGDGLFLALCKEKGIEAQGVDFSGVAVAHCADEGLKATQVDITAAALPFADKAFPTAVSLDVLEHVYDPSALLAEMKRVSAKSIIIGVPNFSSLPARLQVLLGRVPENNKPHKGHIYWFNYSVLRALVKQNGLEIVALRVNAPWARVPLIGFCTRALARVFPDLFALSFVVVCKH